MERPQMLSLGMVSQALSDPGFRTRCPEFSGIPAPGPEPVRGCCHNRSRAQQQSRSFFSVASALSPEALGRLKSYFGIGKLMLNLRDPATGAVTLKVV